MPPFLPGLAPRLVANQLLRCFRAEADLLRVLGGWTARVAENDERLALATDVGLRAEHADAIKSRLHRLRTTDRMFHVPAPEWRALIELLDAAPSTEDLFAATYSCLGPALVDAYEQLLHDCDPLADEPTIRLVSRHLLPDHAARNAWAAAWLEGRAVDAGYQARVATALDLAGGLVVRDDAVPADRSDDEAPNGTGFWPLPRPSPERIHLGREYRIAVDGEQVSYCPGFEEFGPRDVEVLVVHHGLMPEIASLAIVGSVIHEVADRPWSFYRDFATQCADEVRHIGLLLRRLEELDEGADAHPFPVWTFYDAVAWLPAPERTLVFNAIVEGNVVETLHDRVRALQAAGNTEAAYLMDWISADESLHLRNGMTWLQDVAAGPEDVDHLLNRGQALLGTVMQAKSATNRVFDSASESLRDGEFYGPRKNPVAPIARELGGFRPDQIDRLIDSADGRTVRL